jgi:hypothetical protein
MPDQREHRGAHPEDTRLFGPAALAQLQQATEELSWLYERGYKQATALKLVGDRHALDRRQRDAIARCACAESVARQRRARSIGAGALAGEVLLIDGFNALTTLEVALSGGVVLIGRDGCARDIAGVHGSYRSVEETEPALAIIAELTRALRVATCDWLLDAPVSNSGRLRALITANGQLHGVPWQAQVVPNPDLLLAQSEHVVASADGAVLDRVARAFNLSRLCVETYVTRAFVVDLSGE